VHPRFENQWLSADHTLNIEDIKDETDLGYDWGLDDDIRCDRDVEDNIDCDRDLEGGAVYDLTLEFEICNLHFGSDYWNPNKNMNSISFY
jgi:hypothetical protein